MEEEDECAPVEARHYYLNTGMYHNSPEKEKEINIDDTKSKSFNSDSSDVYVAVGENDDLQVLKWAIHHHHALSSASATAPARVFLIHVFPPFTHIPTPIGKLLLSQLSEEQVKKYVMGEDNRRKSLMEKYIGLCNDAKVPVETMLIESNVKAKAILDLIHVLNIAQLVIGTKTPPSSRRRTTRMGIGEVVKEKAPGSCQVNIVHDGKKVEENFHSSSQSPREFRKKMCGCFPLGK